MRSLIYIVFALIFISGCAKNEDLTATHKVELNNVPNSKKQSVNQTLDAGDDWIWVANQTSNKIEIYAPNTDWSSTATGIQKFSWGPTAGTNGNGYSTYAIGKWDRPNDFKVRYVSAWGGNYLCSVGGGGLATIAAYPSGQKKWAYAIPQADGVTYQTSNPHGCEILPNGNIAVAATKRNMVMLFGSSTGVDNTSHDEVYLYDAHAVLWDPVNNCLWAIGRDLLFKIEIEGTAANPILKVVGRYSLASEWGHDLSIDLTDSNRMYYSTNAGTYIFTKSTGVSTSTPAGLQKSFVKSISNQSSGSFVITRADSVKPSSSKPNGSANETWNTRYADLHSSSGTWLLSQTRKVGSTWQEFYKAKVFRTPY